MRGETKVDQGKNLREALTMGRSIHDPLKCTQTSIRTFLADDNIHLTMLLQVLSRLESLRALSVVLGLVHLVNSVKDHRGTCESDTGVGDGDAHVSLHGKACRDSSVGGILAHADERDASSLESLRSEGVGEPQGRIEGGHVGKVWKSSTRATESRITRC
jgi:hypothetical protein